MEKINSHIQMPKGVLKKFVNQSNSLYYYDITTKAIKKGTPKSLNTQENYFNADMEEFLNKKIETPFLKVLRYIENHIDNDIFSLPDDFIHSIKEYFNALLARNPKMCDDSIESTSLAKFFLNQQSQHILTVLSALEIIEKQNMFGDYSITFIKNNTQLPFILPIMGMYSYTTNNGEKKIILPITEKIAILMIDNNFLTNYVDSTGCRILFEINNQDDIIFYNQYALKFQETLGYGYVVSSDRHIIQSLLNIDSNKIH